MLDAPIFKDVNSADGATGIVRVMGGHRVQFGVIETRHGENVEIDLERNAMPQRTTSRIGISKPPDVAVPTKGLRLTD